MQTSTSDGAQAPQAGTEGRGSDRAERPRRIQLSRAKGWRKPPHTVVVARPTKWGNPFPISATGSAARSVALFGAWLESTPAGQALAAAAREELAGKNLACWCALGAPCHAERLLAAANIE